MSKKNYQFCPKCSRVLNVKGFCAWCGYRPEALGAVKAYPFPTEVS